MKLIKEITEFIDEELEGVEDYIKFATKIKGENQTVFDALMTIIPQEIKHIEIWHDVAVKEIVKAKQKLATEGKEPPEYMIEMWNEAHIEYIEELAQIKYKLEMLNK